MTRCLPFYEIDFSDTQLTDPEELEYYKREQQRKFAELEAWDKRDLHRVFRMGMTC